MRVKKPFIKNLSSRGSFLISTALFVMAASMLGVLLLQMYRLFDYNKDLQVTQVRLEAVQEALETYYQRNNNRYPCPADPTEPLDTARFGREASANCSHSGPPDGTQRVPGRAGRFVRIGALPVRDLGISDTYAVDKWGNKLIYAVTENYATATPPAPGLDEGAIKIEDAVGHNATSEPHNVIYAVLSHGPDKRGAYTLTGEQPIPCPATGLAAKNCDGNDAIFVNTTRKNYDLNMGANTYTYTAAYRANMLGHDWSVSAWGACTGDCLVGSQSRAVDCRNTIGAILGDPACSDRGPKPPATQACIAHTCVWMAGGFTPVPPACARAGTGTPVTCGSGVQEQKVHCQRSDGFGDPAMLWHNPFTATPAATPATKTLADAQCGSGRPAESQACNPTGCVCGSAASAPAATTEPTTQKCDNPVSPNVVSPVTENAPTWRWTWECNGGSAIAADNALCSQKRAAICGTPPASLAPPAAGLCAVGDASPPAAVGGIWQWTCDTGAGGTTSPPCSSARVAQCGSSNNILSATIPASGLCAVGSASGVSSGASWTWTCDNTGVGGGTAPCSAPRPAQCGPSNGVLSATIPASGLCDVGTASAPAAVGGIWQWTCDNTGVGGTITSPPCSAPMPAPPVNGVCGTAFDTVVTGPPAAGTLCAQGTPNTVYYDPGALQWQWACGGSGGGLNQGCWAWDLSGCCSFTLGSVPFTMGPIMPAFGY